MAVSYGVKRDNFLLGPCFVYKRRNPGPVLYWKISRKQIYYLLCKKIRSLKKEPKPYLWGWSEVKDEAARFENLIASHLLKLAHFITDYGNLSEKPGRIADQPQ